MADLIVHVHPGTGEGVMRIGFDVGMRLVWRSGIPRGSADNKAPHGSVTGNLGKKRGRGEGGYVHLFCGSHVWG
jgi:hypothetical protein